MALREGREGLGSSGVGRVRSSRKELEIRKQAIRPFAGGGSATDGGVGFQMRFPSGEFGRRRAEAVAVESHPEVPKSFHSEV